MITGVHPYLITNGNGQEAVKFYQDVFDAELIGVQTYGDIPPDPEFPVPENVKDLVVHANLKIDNTYLLISDNFPGQPYEQGTHITIAALVDDADKANRIFEKLQKDGEVIMPLQETHWSPAYGQVKDKYGVTWQISTVTE